MKFRPASPLPRALACVLALHGITLASASAAEPADAEEPAPSPTAPAEDASAPSSHHAEQTEPADAHATPAGGTDTHTEDAHAPAVEPAADEAGTNPPLAHAPDASTPAAHLVHGEAARADEPAHVDTPIAVEKGEHPAPLSPGAHEGEHTAAETAHPAHAESTTHAESTAKDAHGLAEPPAHGHAAIPDKPGLHHDIAADERASLLRIGDAKLTSGDHASALIAYRQVAQATDVPDEKARALLGLARAYRLAGDGVKSVATYERLIKDHADFAEIPVALLELGRTLRDLGSPKLAIARFYSVIHSTLKLPEAESERYRRIVRTAQFEIAETHLATGNYSEAVRFFQRLDLLDLAPADRARARFKAAQARMYSGDTDAAIGAFRVFIAQDPDDPHSPEARYLLARLLADKGRRDDSLRVTLDLLTHESQRGQDTDRWRAWQRRTGNQLANQFYEQGEFSSALLLYRALDALDPSPAWRVPVLYQIGLCQERLAQTTAAVATYEEIKKLAGDTPSPELADTARMAAWRVRQLAWADSAREQLGNLRPPETRAPLPLPGAVPPQAASL